VEDVLAFMQKRFRRVFGEQADSSRVPNMTEEDLRRDKAVLVTVRPDKIISWEMRF
jgi:hypothetical protein